MSKMKILLLILFVLSVFRHTNCVGQVYVDGVAIDTVDTPFIQLIGTNGGGLTRVSILIDSGQKPVSIPFSRQRIAGPDKQPIQFRSTIDALNFITKQGWELIAFDSSSDNVYVYLLRRRMRPAK